MRNPQATCEQHQYNNDNKDNKNNNDNNKMMMNFY
jgi:hypothetical protein